MKLLIKNRSLKLKIPPALQTLIFGVLMWLIDKYVFFGSFTIPKQKIISKVIFLFGAMIAVIAVWKFLTIKTSSDPTNPSKATNLVTDGIYSYSRNPMYLAIAIVLFSWMIALGNLINIFILLLFIWYITKYQIKPEEEVLLKIFGKDYNEYYKKVRRWI